MNHLFNAAFAAFANFRIRKSEGMTRRYAAPTIKRQHQDRGMTRAYVMISVNPPYARMILSGYKTFEFRKAILKEMDSGYPQEDIRALIYETKNKGGTGKVIGEVSVIGSYAPRYEQSKHPDSELIKERYFFIKHLYLTWCNLNFLRPNLNEGWFKSAKFSKYQKEIGFNDTDFNYALILDRPLMYPSPMVLSLFKSLRGIPLVRPPQNMFRILR
ncbi:MAG TPA: hypothetical protein PKB13_08780 [Clostridia bacterium]|nr:hypothetical protein [Clostridia bacterium]